jgi:hypothetical protein
MTQPDSLTRAEQFLSAHARPLERALFARRFRAGPAEPVVAALEAYRNADGGFGRALEPDVRAPESMALHAEVALRALADAGIRDAEIARRLCRSLAAQAEPSGRVPIVDRAARTRTRRIGTIRSSQATRRTRPRRSSASSARRARRTRGWTAPRPSAGSGSRARSRTRTSSSAP